MGTVIANVVWPALFLEMRALAWWIIGLGLLIEFCFLLSLTRADMAKAAWMTLVMNFASTVLGVIGVPLAGILWELVAAFTVYPLFGSGTFTPVSWAVSCLLAAALNSLVEAGVLSRSFGIAWRRELIGTLFVANLITVGIAMGSILQPPPA
ncbi:MAG: hypothetical protein AAGJ46_12855 [Planctomycetota bacterium]